MSIIDAANPLVFIHASSLGLKGTESPSEIEADKGLMRLIERIRGEACVMIGLVEKPEDAATKTPYQPFFAIVSEPADYQTISGAKVKAANVDLVSRLLFMLRMHKTYPVTGTVCTGAAVRVPGMYCVRGAARGSEVEDDSSDRPSRRDYPGRSRLVHRRRPGEDDAHRRVSHRPQNHGWQTYT